MTTEAELRRGYGLNDDFLLEVDDRDEAETIHAALIDYSAKQWRAVREYAANPTLAAYYKQLAHKADSIDRRLEELLWPEDAEPLREGDPYFNGAFGGRL